MNFPAWKHGLSSALLRPRTASPAEGDRVACLPFLRQTRGVGTGVRHQLSIPRRSLAEGMGVMGLSDPGSSCRRAEDTWTLEAGMPEQGSMTKIAVRLVQRETSSRDSSLEGLEADDIKSGLVPLLPPLLRPSLTLAQSTPRQMKPWGYTRECHVGVTDWPSAMGAITRPNQSRAGCHATWNEVMTNFAVAHMQFQASQHNLCCSKGNGNNVGTDSLLGCKLPAMVSKESWQVAPKADLL